MEAGCRETWRLTWPPTPPLASLLEKGKDDQRQLRRVRLRGGSQHTPTLPLASSSPGVVRVTRIIKRLVHTVLAHKCLHHLHF